MRLLHFGVVTVVVGLVYLVLAGDSSHGYFRLFSKDDKSRGLFDFLFASHAQSKYASSSDEYNTAFSDPSTRNQSMVDDYYTIATDFYEYGWSQSFHFALTGIDEEFAASLVRHEQRISDAAGLKPGQKVLDIGCGVGGPARNIARHSKSKVTGITINQYQIDRATNHTRNEGLQDLVSFKRMDFTKMEFESNTFDNAYAIEATCHAPQLTDVYSEAFRVLKPGGKFASYEWLLTPKFDANNPIHAKAKYDIEYGNALPPLRNAEDCIKAAKEVGFEVLSSDDLVLEEKEGVTRPWYNKLHLGILSTYLTHVTCWVSETFGFAPQGTIATHKVLMHALDGLVAGGQEKIFTPMHLIIMQKPGAASADTEKAEVPAQTETTTATTEEVRHEKEDL